MKYSIEEIRKNDNLIKIVNEVFHDFDSENYEKSHPEIYLLEKKEWKNIFIKYIKDIQNEKPLIILDIGTGAGFVPEVFSSYLKENDKVIFSDISEKMIKLVNKKFNKVHFKKDFLISDASKINLDDNSVNVVTINSVLHHIPDYGNFLREIDRVLMPGGILIIKHEPNKLFANSFVLSNVYNLLKKIREKLQNDKRDISLGDFERKILYSLKEKGIELKKDISKRDIQILVDIESPTASGKLDKSRGFDPFLIKKEYFKDYDNLKIRTYAFLCKIDENKNIGRKVISKILKLFSPQKGYLFELILKKHGGQ